MYARVARWEGADAEAHEGICGEESRPTPSRGPPEGLPAKSLLLLHDYEGGRAIAITLFETEDDYRQGDETLELDEPARRGMGSASASTNTRSPSNSRPEGAARFARLSVTPRRGAGLSQKSAPCSPSSSRLPRLLPSPLGDGEAVEVLGRAADLALAHELDQAGFVQLGDVVVGVAERDLQLVAEVAGGEDAAAVDAEDFEDRDPQRMGGGPRQLLPVRPAPSRRCASVLRWRIPFARLTVARVCRLRWHMETLPKILIQVINFG